MGNGCSSEGLGRQCTKSMLPLAIEWLLMGHPAPPDGAGDKQSDR
jgi:hypothetical protein